MNPYAKIQEEEEEMLPPNLAGAHVSDDEEESKDFGEPLDQVKKMSWALPDKAPEQELPDIDDMEQ